jgi:hypothetical protein
VTVYFSVRCQRVDKFLGRLVHRLWCNRRPRNPSHRMVPGYLVYMTVSLLITCVSRSHFAILVAILSLLGSEASSWLLSSPQTPLKRSAAPPLPFSITSYPLSSTAADWAAFVSFRTDSDADWRIPSALKGLPSIVQVLLVGFVLES